MTRMAMPSPIAEYLLRLERGLWDIPRGRRVEILADVQVFLEESLLRANVPSQAALAWLLVEHGTPERLAQGFRVSAWKDRVIHWGGFLVAPMAGLAWMVFMGTLMGLDHRTPGYYSFLADFPCLMLVIVSVRGFWKRLPCLRRFLLSSFIGLMTGLIFCHEVCKGQGIAMLEHGFYGAFFGLVIERAAEDARLTWGLLDVGGFLVLMQLTFMGHTARLAPMDSGPLAYHLLNGLGVELLVWGAFRIFWSLRQSTFFLAPEM